MKLHFALLSFQGVLVLVSCGELRLQGPLVAPNPIKLTLEAVLLLPEL